MRWVLGIDIGGTNLVAGAVAEDGSRVVGDHSRPTDAGRGANAVVHDVVEMAQASLAALREADPAAHVLGVGAGAPGPLDTRRGVVLFTPNLGWVNLPLRALLADGLGLPTAIENDANAAVLGESWAGAARGAAHVIGLTIGTGIGGGIVIGGQLYHGAADAAAEFGHMVIDLDGPVCGCGNHGCLEAFASGKNIARRAAELLSQGVPSSLSQSVHGDHTQLTAQMVYQAAANGDAVGLQVAADTARYLGIGIANLLNIFNPDMVVILGGVTDAGALLFDPLQREVAARAFKPAVDSCRIVPGALRGLAGVYGAARAFLEQQQSGVI
jgi:glucokinase